MMENSIRETNLKNDTANQKDLVSPISVALIQPKRIRKRIKYYRKPIAELRELTAISKPDEIAQKTIF